MPSLFKAEPPQVDTGIARGVSGIVSVSLQLALGAVVVMLAGAANPEIARVALARPRLISPVFPAAPPRDVRMPASRAKASIETKAPEPAPEPPAPVAVREVEPAAAPTPPAPVMRPAPALTPPAAPRPAVSVGAFDTPAAVASATPPPQRVETAGFNLPAAQATQSRLAPASIGTFDSRPAADRRPADRVNTVVADSGFGEANPTPRPAPQSSRAIRDSGFGAAASGERAEVRAGAVAASAGFADARAVEQTRRADAAPARPAILPVEVLSKPSPAYTDEARRLKIEGDVVLEVEFSTAGTVRVLRIVRGLGYGLDESATTAAQKIQFKPATSEGRPVDYKTTVRIEFRLA